MSSFCILKEFKIITSIRSQKKNTQLTTSSLVLCIILFFVFTCITSVVSKILFLSYKKRCSKSESQYIVLYTLGIILMPHLGI